MLSKQTRGFRLFLGSCLLLGFSLLASWSSLVPDVGARLREAAVTPAVIETVAGGGVGSSVPVREAPMELPTAVVLDPQGRGFFVLDEVDGVSLLRFVNTSTSPVTLAGAVTRPNEINLIAGGGLRTEDNVPARDADLAKVTGVTVDPTGTLVVMASPALGALRAVNLGTTEQTIYGVRIAPGMIATVVRPSFADVRAVLMQRTTRELFFIAGAIVYRVDASGNITPYAGGGAPATGNGDGGAALQAKLVNPRALTFDTNGDLLIAEGGSTRSAGDGAVRRVTSAGIITSVATGLAFPVGITVAPNGSIYIAAGNAQQLQRVGRTGAVSVLAGNNVGEPCDQRLQPTCGDGGPALGAALNLPDSASLETITLASDDRGIFLPDYRFRRVRLINTTTGVLTLLGTSIGAQQINRIVGSGAPAPYDRVAATSSDLNEPTGLAVDARGDLYIADTRANRLRFVNRGAQPVTLFLTTDEAVVVQPGDIITLNREAGNATLPQSITTATFSSPQGLLATPRGLYVVDSQAGALIRNQGSIVGRRSGVISFLNTSASNVVFYAGTDAQVVVPPAQVRDVAGVRAPSDPQGLGDGQLATRVAFYPTDIALDGDGNLLIADQGNHRIRRVNLTTGIVSTVYGNGETTTLNRPTGITFDSSGRLLIADTRNNRILRQNAAGATAFTVIADAGRGINQPRDLVVDRAGRIFITNAGTHQVLDLEAPTNALGTTSVVAGTGMAGFSGDGSPAAQARLNFPAVEIYLNDIQLTANIVVLDNGNILFTDTGNNRIRELRRTGLAALSNVSAASFATAAEAAPDTIVAAFGSNLAGSTVGAAARPLPTTLAGTSVRIRDAAGAERDAPLFFVAPGQINYLVPPNTALGNATVTVLRDGNAVAAGGLRIVAAAPGLFTVNSTGRGLAAAVALRVKADGTQTFEPIARFDTAQNAFVPVPIDLGPATDRVFLVLYGTGIRGRSSLSSVAVRFADVNGDVTYAGPQGSLTGLDQVNVSIPRSLIGRGSIDVTLTVDGKAANPVTIQVR